VGVSDYKLDSVITFLIVIGKVVTKEEKWGSLILFSNMKLLILSCDKRTIIACIISITFEIGCVYSCVLPEGLQLPMNLVEFWKTR
jgi:hypothetical protein